jgi:hypothetical protein
MFVYNWLALTGLGLILFRILKINLKIENATLFILLYTILSIDNLVNLSSTRITFILTAAVFAYIESCRYELKEINNFRWTILMILLLFASSMRAEAVMLFTLIYICTLVLQNRFYKKSLLPILFGIVIFMSFNIIISHYSYEAKQVAVYKEKEIVDRHNIDYSKIKPGSILELEVKALTDYAIFDQPHFTFGFYDSISRSRTNMGLRSITDGIKARAFLYTFANSVVESYNCWRFLLYYILSGLLVISAIPKKKIYICLGALIALFPFALCLYTIVPMRFINPYYSIAGTINVLLFVNKTRGVRRAVLLCSMIVFLLSWYELSCRKSYIQRLNNFTHTQSKLKLLAQQSKNSSPVIFNNFDFEKCFPVDPLEKIVAPNAMFLNFFYYEAYEFYQVRWKQACNCNPLSLRDKIDYMVASGSYFLVDQRSFDFMHNYFEMKFHLQLIKMDMGDFDSELKVCKLNYGTPLPLEKMRNSM